MSKEEQNYQLKKSSDFIDEVFRQSNKSMDDFSKFIDVVFKDNKNLFDERDKIKKEYDFGEYDDFNILTVTNFGWGETAHSETLCKILDPNTPVIGSKKNLVEFFNLIGLTKKEINEWDFNTTGVNIEVTENKLSEWFEADNKSINTEGRIDILISDNRKNCVIIENKLKNAPNMPNQLERYVRIVQNHNLKIHKIVYIPPTKDKKPDDCDNEYKKERKEIEDNNWLVTIPAVRSMDDENVKSLVQDYFPKLMKENLSETNIIKLAFFDQYQKLIAKLGENEIMSANEKEIVKLLCGTSEYQKYTNELIKLINGNGGYDFIALKIELLCEYFNGEDKNFKPDIPEDFIEVRRYWKKLKYPKSEDIFIYFYLDPNGYAITTKDLDEVFCAELEKIMKTNIQDNANISNGIDNKNWWYCYVSSGIAWEKSIPELADEVKRIVSIIQQALLK